MIIPKFSFTLATLFCTMAILCSCDQSQNSEADGSVVITHEEHVDGNTEKYVAKMSIDGMACEMMCGNKIASALSNLNGVKQADIEFNGIDSLNFAVVEFDEDKVSESDLIKTVQALAEGHYKVKSMTIIHYAVDPMQRDLSESDRRWNLLPAPEYKMPNIFGIFARLF